MKRLGGLVLIVVLLLGGCTIPLPSLKDPEVDGGVLLGAYVTALQQRNLTAFREQIVSAKFAHKRRDESIEDKTAYLSKLQQLLQLTVKSVEILDQSWVKTPRGVEINVHWKITLNLGLFVKPLVLIDKTTLVYAWEGVAWKLIDDSPIVKDASVVYNGMSRRELDYYHAPSYQFSIMESKIYAWGGYEFPTEFLNLTHVMDIKWYDPTGKVFFENKNFLTPTETGWAYWTPMEVKGKVPTNLKGEWKVVVYLDELLMFEQVFQITN